MATVLSPLPPPLGGGPPPLMAGDHLDQATFHARYLAMPEGLKAELVAGVVYMPPLYSPHGRMHARVVTWLVLYEAATPGVEAHDNTSVVLADDGEPQPDACLTLSPAHGGQTHLDEEKQIVGAPELVVEVAYSSDAYDLHAKKQDYERGGVREYVVVLLREHRVAWFVRRASGFEERPASEDGLLRSKVFPGLWLDPAALLRLDVDALRRALEQGLASPEHLAFVAR